MEVHLLSGGFQYEGSRVIRVYRNKEDAMDMCAKLEKYRASRPFYGEDNDYVKWRNACPIKDAEGYDYYSVTSMELT